MYYFLNHRELFLRLLFLALFESIGRRRDAGSILSENQAWKCSRKSRLLTRIKFYLLQLFSQCPTSSKFKAHDLTLISR
ncbi:unnamed protein product [Coffea canephora]|uniref:Secreted protein n=1 Tax=Coffea canephora TaxID=49390 RepID=A0A068TPP0_COFCA|nr:unnamed protein product [Coffea canephora]